MAVDLSTRYLGLKLKNPFVAAASPMTAEIESLQALEEHGAAAVVLPSLFEEQLDHEAMAVHGALEHGAHAYAEAAGGYLPELDDFRVGPDEYLRLIEQAKKRLEVPVIASLNGTSAGGWVEHARRLVEAGADALELNIYLLATDPYVAGAEVELRNLELVSAVREVVDCPLAVKIGPWFSSIPYIVRRFADCGANGVVLFNRFLQPDVDLEQLEVTANHRLSTAAELLLPLRWIAILRGRVPVSLAASGGVHRAGDALKMLLIGADCVQLAACLLMHGPQHLGALLRDVEAWLEEKEYHSVEQLKGSLSQRACPDPETFERGQYMRMLRDYATPDT